MSPQSEPITNAEPMSVPIVYSYPDELQPVNQAKNKLFCFSQTEASI